MSTPARDPESPGRGATTRENLLRAAGEQFAEAGYQGASLGKILDCAGVTKGALYFHFVSKRALADAVITESIARKRREVALARRGQLDPLHGLIVGFEAAVQVSLRDPVVLGGERLLDDPLIGSGHSGDQYLVGESLMDEAFHEAAAAGLLRAGLDLEATARNLVATMAGYRLICTRTRTLDQLPHRLAEMWRSTLPLIARDSWLRSNPLFAERPPQPSTASR